MRSSSVCNAYIPSGSISRLESVEYCEDGRCKSGRFILIKLLRSKYHFSDNIDTAAKVYNLPYKPPVTLAIMAANFAIHFRDHVLPQEVARLVPSISEGCIQPYAILNGQWMRLIWSAFLHLDDSHVYYNMASLLVKGLQMESQMGSKRFCVLVAELLVLSHGFMALGCAFLGENYYELRYLSRSMCAAGFSAVLFALKVVLTHDDPGTSQLLSIAVPTKYLAWAELLLIHYLVPQSSFAGHLAGVMAGFVHVKLIHPILMGSLFLRGGRRRVPGQGWMQWLASALRLSRPRVWGGGRLGSERGAMPPSAPSPASRRTGASTPGLPSSQPWYPRAFCSWKPAKSTFISLQASGEGDMAAGEDDTVL
ncbi:hypothetical protein DUNSADRAFT_3147 [Dunaliella salina]|uniref:Peptidase S54 rhomboid domain-containing protein n=1 Tax=Dunaliella salina TaxID=3046 RepID=A0ABQ7H863_DUNSA|nr:hypothetical protein DUNSADRAFT_3147 [Dunaliella salina]|eukprot:KAF5843018.1 hypothetical protein DUNSADRAFT_3147 [Dunaliella salina]